MARAGLGPAWKCLFANDYDARKAATYAVNWGPIECKDVAEISISELPPHAQLAWASFPCQDLSVAGEQQGGLTGHRSGAFWPFWKLISTLRSQNRAPSVVVLENVSGLLTVNAGQDFKCLLAALAKSRYRFGALLMDAIHFLPQSRPRIFVVAIAEEAAVPTTLRRCQPDPLWASNTLVKAHASFSQGLRSRWIWWALPAPPVRSAALVDLLDSDPVCWHAQAETQRLLTMMDDANRSKVEAARGLGRLAVGTLYKRMRGEAGRRIQRCEVRFDAAGCLRAPTGGSSRQSLLFVEGASTRSRLLSAREAARLMGLPEEYQLPTNYTEAYQLIGDGVAVPVVRYLSEHLLQPLLQGLN